MSAKQRYAGLTLVAALALAGTTSGRAAEPAEGVRRTHARSVVGLKITSQAWDEDRPWARQNSQFRTASAVMVAPNRLLTTMQVLEDAVLVTLVPFGREVAVQPRILLADPSINLALLEVDPSPELDGLRPVPVAARTPGEGVLRTVRWSGQQLESASSRINRFQVHRSWRGRVEHAFLRMRTDLAQGGWAEPVFDDGHLVGITVAQSGQESRAIPAEILTEFLARAAESPYPGFAALGALWQVNRDQAVSRYLGQEGPPRGILLRQVPWGSSACGVLKPRDILLEVAGESIDAEGVYRHPRLGQIRFTHMLTTRHRPGATVPVKVLREGRELELAMTLRRYPAELDLIPSRRSGPPFYVMVGGLVLREMDVPYLHTWGKEWASNAPIHLLTRYFLGQEAQTPDLRRLIVISSVLPSPDNIGYQDLRDDVVVAINGRPLSRMEDVVEALGMPQDGYQVLDLAAESSPGKVIFDADDLGRITAAIMEQYRLPAAARLPATPLPEGGGNCPEDF